MRVLRGCIAGLGLAASVVVLSSPATADGYYRRGPGLSACCFNWTGFYIGANAGLAGSDLSNALSVTNLENPGLFSAANIAILNEKGSQNLDANGFIGGVQAGYNIQSGGVVWGLELDINRMRLRDNAGGLFNGIGGAFTLTEEASTNWLFTLRPRLGFVMDRSMFYVTGGLAVTKFEFKQNFSAAGPPASALAISTSDTKAGWTIGAGLEAALSRTWTLKGEYLFARFDVDDPAVGTLTGTLQGVTRNATFANRLDDLDVHTLRVGLNYKFGGCCDVRPLK
jgi:outer membrane immunogenic protein